MSDRAPRNRTLTCTPDEVATLSGGIKTIDSSVSEQDIEGRVINGDLFHIAEHLPKRFIDLLILDPPYNLSKNYNGVRFKQKQRHDYETWFRAVLDAITPLLKPQATIYTCADWKTSAIILPVLESVFHVRNRITWEREKGRGAKSNWKNNTEDIWFCTQSDDYHFDVDSVKLKRKVIAPYRVNGKPKDWNEERAGNFRLTHPSNIWTDITVPFWSMPENTDHPTQKPEKLIAKLILASSQVGDFVFDPFLGSGTTAVVAKKLQRRWSGIDINKEYLCWALKRLSWANDDHSIQGYADGVFWERNSLSDQQTKESSPQLQDKLFA